MSRLSQNQSGPLGFYFHITVAATVVMIFVFDWFVSENKLALYFEKLQRKHDLATGKLDIGLWQGDHFALYPF